MSAEARDVDLADLTVHFAGGCRCGHGVLIMSADQKLVCARCRRDRGQMSSTTAAFIAETIKYFGRPTEPIVVRRKESKL
jgi:hypothetical protein